MEANGRDLHARERAIGILCAVLSVILFSSFVLVSRLGYSASLALRDIVGLRFGVGGALLLPVLLRHGLTGVRWREASLLAALGGLGFALLAYTGFALVPATDGTVVLHGTLPLTTFAMLRVTSRQAAPRTGLAGFVLIGIGVALIAYSSSTGATLRQLIGDGLLLLASVSWSAYGVVVRRLGLPAAQTAAIVAVFSMCCFVPIYAVLPGSSLSQVGTQALLLQAVVQGVLIGGVSILVYTRAVTALGPAGTAMFTAAVPCVTTLAAMPLLSEFPTVAEWTGMAIVTLGMIVAVRTTKT